MTTSGWSTGEWSDMAWSTGVDYDYEPVVFLDAEGSLVAYAKSGALASFAASNTPVVLAKSGTLNTSKAAPPGSLVAFTASGPLLTYMATGALADGTEG